MSKALPVLTVIGLILCFWYAGSVLMNAQWERDQAARAGVSISFAQIVPKTMVQDRPV